MKQWKGIPCYIIGKCSYHTLKLYFVLHAVLSVHAIESGEQLKNDISSV